MATLFSPLLKLTGLVIKVVAKPMAQALKTAASKRPWLHRRFVSLGQVSHVITSRVNVYASGYKFVGVKPLPEEEALKKAIEFVSDFLVYSSAAGIVVIEFIRSEKKNAEKAEKALRKEKDEMKRIEDRFQELETFVMDIEDVLPPQSQSKLNSIRKKRLEEGDHVTLKTINNDKLVEESITEAIWRTIKFW